MSFSGINTNNPGSILDAIAEMHASLLASIPTSSPPPAFPASTGSSGSFVNFALPIDTSNISIEATQASEGSAEAADSERAPAPRSVIPALPDLPPLTTIEVGEETGFLPILGLSAGSPQAPSEFNSFFDSFVTTVFADEGAGNALPPQITTLALGEETASLPPAEVTTLAIGEETGGLPPPTQVAPPETPNDPVTPAPEESVPPTEAPPAEEPTDESAPPATVPSLLDLPPPPPAITLARGEEGSLFTFDEPRNILLS